MKAVAMAILLLLSSAESTAGASPASIVTNVLVMYNTGGQVIFYTSAAHTGAPVCATQNTRWVFSGATPAGQATLSLVMTAYTTGKPLTIYGTGACDIWGDTETVNYINS